MEESATTSTGPLSGIRVADFSRVLAGPYATMMLADMGADVIKIESPEGDGTRQWSPPSNAIGQSTYFAGVNRGKRSVVADLSTAAGQQLARELASTADVVIENFKPGTMAKFGLDYATISALNPAIVYCSISGFGDTLGSELPGYDLLVQAVGGLMSITGQSDAEGGEPTKVGVALVDILTGLNAVIGIQAALQARTANSQLGGQHIKVTLLHSLLAALANQAASTLETGQSPARMGNAHPSIAPYETFSAADQALAIAVGTDGQFARLCTILERPELASDQRFSTNPSRVANRQALRAELSAVLVKQPAAAWIKKFQEAKIPAGQVNTIAQAIALAESLDLHPVAQTRATDDTGATQVLRSVALPIQFSKTPPTYQLPPPKIGEHQGATWL